MSKLEHVILESIRTTGRFRFSSDSHQRLDELEAINNLIASGLIVKTAESIGYINGYAI